MAVSFQQLVDKVITDHQFRSQFEKDKVAAVESLGVAMNPQLKQALGSLDMNNMKAIARGLQGPACFT